MLDRHLRTGRGRRRRIRRTGIRVSQTEKASTLIVHRARQVDRRKTMPVSGGAGRASSRPPRHRARPRRRLWSSTSACVRGTSYDRRRNLTLRHGSSSRSAGSVGLLAQEHRDLISSMPLLASASTFAAAVRPVRHTLGVDRPAVVVLLRRRLLTCWLRTGRSWVPVRCTGALCTTEIGGACTAGPGSGRSRSR